MFLQNIIELIKEIMNKYLWITSTLFLLFLICSCSNDEHTTPQEEEKEEKKEDTRYYVKYEITSNTQHINAIKTITFSTDKGTKTIELTGSKNSEWEATYGPVSKDFVAHLECSVNNYSYSRNFHARIYISRDKEPFVIKAEDDGKTISLKSTIDF